VYFCLIYLKCQHDLQASQATIICLFLVLAPSAYILCKMIEWIGRMKYSVYQFEGPCRCMQPIFVVWFLVWKMVRELVCWNCKRGGHSQMAMVQDALFFLTSWTITKMFWWESS
jgi:hypothetical protein